jgi:hypothetical protein
MLTSTLYDMSFSSALADPDGWLCSVNEEGGQEYYEDILLYFVDLFAISKQPSSLTQSGILPVVFMG